MKEEAFANFILPRRDASLCVLCGEPNQCALSKTAEAGSEEGAGRREEARCWCFEETFPSALLSEATRIDQGAGCICQRCLSSAVEPEV